VFTAGPKAQTTNFNPRDIGYVKRNDPTAAVVRDCVSVRGEVIARFASLENTGRGNPPGPAAHQRSVVIRAPVRP
jgi:hypothetical protein